MAALCEMPALGDPESRRRSAPMRGRIPPRCACGLAGDLLYDVLMPADVRRRNLFGFVSDDHDSQTCFD